MMHELSVDKKGTHSIQAVLDTCLTSDEEDFIAQELHGYIADLASVWMQFSHCLFRILKELT